jgi:hypothetical protein
VREVTESEIALGKGLGPQRASRRRSGRREKE